LTKPLSERPAGQDDQLFPRGLAFGDREVEAAFFGGRLKPADRDRLAFADE